MQGTQVRKKINKKKKNWGWDGLGWATNSKAEILWHNSIKQFLKY